jgi:hypothetical protein
MKPKSEGVIWGGRRVGRVSQRDTEYETARYPMPVAMAMVVNTSGSQEFLLSFLDGGDMSTSMVRVQNLHRSFEEKTE